MNGRGQDVILYWEVPAGIIGGACLPWGPSSRGGTGAKSPGRPQAEGPQGRQAPNVQPPALHYSEGIIRKKAATAFLKPGVGNATGRCREHLRHSFRLRA